MLKKNTTKINNIERKYCSCVAKVRATLKKRNPRSPYAICTSSVYNKQNRKRKRRVECYKYYNFNKFSMKQLKAYAKEKKIKLSHKGRMLRKPQLVQKIVRFNINNNRKKKTKLR